MHAQFKLLAAVTAVAMAIAGAIAGVSAERPRPSARTLTAIGAEKAGNKRRHHSGLHRRPDRRRRPASRLGDGIRPNPYAIGQAAPVRSTPRTWRQHAANLTEGTKALMQKYPTLPRRRLPDAPQRRLPEVGRSTTPRRTRSTAKTLNEGRSMEGAHAGFPFPIPKTGNEAMWNHLVRFNGQAYEAKYRNLNVDASGRTDLATEGVEQPGISVLGQQPRPRPRPSGASSSRTPARRAAPARR